jgi:hypothetical protein
MDRPRRAPATITDRLRIVLSGAIDRRQLDRLEQVRLCRELLDPADFRRLFEVDTTWGDFGERRQHYDDQLHVVAMTNFVPLERETARNADDVTLLVTPIHRILLTLTAITLRENNFEGYGDRDLLLPHRPRVGTEVGRYISLLEVACSLWLEVCHAYVRQESPTLVEELYCFNVGRTRANYLWIDYSSETCEATVRYTSITTLSTPACLVLSPMELAPVAVDVHDNHHHHHHHHQSKECSLRLQSCTTSPMVHLVGASSQLSAYVLLTRDGGTYVSFHRVVEGRFTRYPLYFHLFDALDEDPRSPSCTVCGVQSALIKDPLDTEQGLLYCGRACIEQMERIRHAKTQTMEEARAHIARQQGMPPGRK